MYHNYTLNVLGVDSREYKSQSFRAGAATTHDQQGCCNIDIIQAAGRWRSNVYCSYIRELSGGVFYLLLHKV